MIENDIVRYLSSDATLTSLLSASTTNKFFPDVMPEKPSLPCITFSWSYEPPNDELIETDKIKFNIFGSNKSNAISIRDRITLLLSRKDEIQSALYSYSTNYYIYWIQLTGGDSMFEPQRENFQITLYFEIEYKSKS